MIYERHGDYEVMEYSEFGECGVWKFPGAMDEVDPIIILPTIEAARIWVSKKLAPLGPAPAAASEGGWKSAGAYSYNSGAIQWENGYEAINQLTKAAAGHEDDSRLMHETLDAIHAIAAQEIENAAKQQPAPKAATGTGGVAARFDKMRAWAFHWQDGNRISVDELSIGTRQLFDELDAQAAQIRDLEAALANFYDEDMLVEFANLCTGYPTEPRLNLFERVFGAQQPAPKAGEAEGEVS